MDFTIPEDTPLSLLREILYPWLVAMIDATRTSPMPATPAVPHVDNENDDKRFPPVRLFVNPIHDVRAKTLLPIRFVFYTSF